MHLCHQKAYPTPEFSSVFSSKMWVWGRFSVIPSILFIFVFYLTPMIQIQTLVCWHQIHTLSSAIDENINLLSSYSSIENPFIELRRSLLPTEGKSLMIPGFQCWRCRCTHSVSVKEAWPPTCGYRRGWGLVGNLACQESGTS